MPQYRYQIRDTQTGETTVHGFEPSEGSRCPFWWLEGNFSCDCNRGREFHRGRGVELAESPECSAEVNRWVFDWVELDGVRFIADDRPTEHAE